MPHIIDILSSPWAILPDRLLQLQGIYAMHMRGERADVEAIEARIGKPMKNDPQGYVVDEGVALIPVRGVIAPRMNLMTEISGGTSAELLVRDVRTAMADTSVDALMLMVDSPGGAVAGTQAATNAIASLRGQKPIGAYAEDLMASAAYWIGSAADPGAMWIASDTTQVGSIGVVATHTDMSRREEALGVRTTEVVAGKFKRITSEHGPLTETGLATIQAQVDHIYAAFVADVARNRGVSVERVLSSMADGRIFLGREAISAGLVDGMATLEAAMQQLKDRAAVGKRTSVAMTKPKRGASMTPQEMAASFAAENPEAAALLRAEGSAGERARVAAVREHSMPGYEALIEELAADGTTNGPEAAMRVLAAVKADANRIGAERRADAPAPIRQVDPVDDVAAAGSNVTPIRSHAGYAVDASSAALDARARAYQAAHPNTDYVAAVKAVTQKGA
jgi:signal peptide peptidase SppA